MSEGRGLSLRERARVAVREEIAHAALEMFDEQGFDETTVEQIAVAADISPRSFFRYFAAKEDVVLGDPMIYGELVRDRLTENVSAMPLWEALRAAFEPVVARTETDPDGTLRATRVMIRTPALRARNTEKHLVWMTALAPIVAATLPGDEERRMYEARAFTVAALTCLDISSAEWVRRDGALGIGKLLDQAFALLKPGALSSSMDA